MANENEREKRETLADIVAEIRAYGAQPPPRLMWLEIADRIEAAWKRDEERAIEHATRHAEAVSRDNCRDCIHNPNGKNYEPVGNAAAMRDALVRIHNLTNSLDEECGVDPVEIRDIARAALDAPARQCDVGTAEEQYRRFEDFCFAHRTRECGCVGCPVEQATCCELVWAQMPYEAEEGAGK